MLSATRIDAATVDLVRRAHVFDWMDQEPPRNVVEASASLKMVANLVQRMPSETDRPLWIADAFAALQSLRLDGASTLLGRADGRRFA